MLGIWTQFFSNNRSSRLNTNLLYRRKFILIAIVSPLVFHSIDLSFCFKQRCQNSTYHKHSTKVLTCNDNEQLHALELIMWLCYSICIWHCWSVNIVKGMQGIPWTTGLKNVMDQNMWRVNSVFFDVPTPNC